MGKGAKWGKRVKKRGETAIFPRCFRSLFSAPFPSSSRLSPLSERLEQAIIFPVELPSPSRGIRLQKSQVIRLRVNSVLWTRGRLRELSGRVSGIVCG